VDKRLKMLATGAKVKHNIKTIANLHQVQMLGQVTFHTVEFTEVLKLVKSRLLPSTILGITNFCLHNLHNKLGLQESKLWLIKLLATYFHEKFELSIYILKILIF
jgi:hypothetical protein